MSWQRFIAVADNHGDKQDNGAVSKVLSFSADWKPHFRVHLGDNWDFRPLRGKASDDERRESMTVDYNKGCRFLEDFRPTHFLRGNHDERLWKLSQEDHGVESDFAIKVTGEIKALLEKLRCKMFPYHYRNGIVPIGQLNMAHGFYAGVGACRSMAIAYGPCLFGHVHTVEENCVPSVKSKWARSIGFIAIEDMGYHEAKPGTLRWEHGFVYGVVNSRTGDYHFWQARKCGGKWMLPSDFA